MDGGLPRACDHRRHGNVATTTPLDFEQGAGDGDRRLPARGRYARRRSKPWRTTPSFDTTLPAGWHAGDGGIGLPDQWPAARSRRAVRRAVPERRRDLQQRCADRVYKAADIQLDMKLNKLGWHFPQARMLALWGDVGPTLSGARAARAVRDARQLGRLHQLLPCQPRSGRSTSRTPTRCARRPTSSASTSTW